MLGYSVIVKFHSAISEALAVTPTSANAGSYPGISAKVGAQLLRNSP